MINPPEGTKPFQTVAGILVREQAVRAPFLIPFCNGEQKAKIVLCFSPMELRCRVTFYDVEQKLNRSIEVQANSLVDAAEIVLRRLMGRFLLPSDFSPTVDIEVISSVHHTLNLSEIENRLRGVAEQQDRAA